MANDLFNSFMNGPDDKGRFGNFGGRFVSETLMPLILELEKQYEKAKTDKSFWSEMTDLWTNYVGRPSPLYFAERLTCHPLVFVHFFQLTQHLLKLALVFYLVL